jgi:ubiquinone biosynthesis UbiH/UbiF/VisC/COQ6 family hydroxylase
MQIWSDTSAQPITLDADEVNADAMAYILEECALRQAMLKEVKAQNLHIQYGVAERFSMQNQQAVLGLDNGQLIQSDLLLAADGAQSWLRQHANIAVTEKDYQQTAIVANFDIEISHADIARQWFRQEQSDQSEGPHCGILAWLPLPGRRVSIVWSAPAAYAQQLMQLDDAAFTQQVMQAGNAALGDMTLLGTRAAFPLHLRKAAELVQDALVLLGDAAHRIHPMAGQGVNLGFRDVIALADILQQRSRYQALHDIRLLKQYARNRKVDVLSMTALTNGLYHLFDSENLMVQKLRNWGLQQTNQPMIRRLLVQTAIAR